MSGYRDYVREVEREVGFTFRKLLKWALIVIPILLLLGWGLQATGIITLSIEREVTQHSRQYTETKASLLEKLHSDYLQLDAEIAQLSADDGNEEKIIAAKRAQQKAIAKRLRTEASRIPASQVPTEINSFLSTH